MTNVLICLILFVGIGLLFYDLAFLAPNPNIDMKETIILTFLYGSIFIILCFPFPIEKYRLKSAIALSVLILILMVYGVYCMRLIK